jgi:hypothetical protein
MTPRYGGMPLMWTILYLLAFIALITHTTIPFLNIVNAQDIELFGDDNAGMLSFISVVQK